MTRSTNERTPVSSSPTRSMKRRKADRRGIATEVHQVIRVRSERNVSWGGAPCSGYVGLYVEPEKKSDHTHAIPSIPWDDSWEPGTIVLVTITVRPLSLAPRSRKKCHNPWPAHVHDADKQRRDTRARRERR